MPEWTIDQIMDWCGAEWIGGDRQPDGGRISGISCDSRTLCAGDLFIALRGDRYDGHAYIGSAVERGASAILIDTRCSSGELAEKANTLHPGRVRPIPVLIVPDTMKALQEMAAGYRMQLEGCVIAVTGSVGKTSTRQMIAACLAPSLRIHQADGNLNNEIGLPQTLLGSDPADQAVILEMGMRGPGEISLLSRIARPDIAVITCIGWSHIGRLGSREAILAAKWEIVEGIRPGGCLILNADDPLLADAARTVPEDCRLAWVCITEKGFAAARSMARTSAFILFARNIQMDALQTAFTADCMVNGLMESRTPVTLPFPGRHHIRNTLFGLAIARALQLDPDGAAAGAASCQTIGNRQRIIRRRDITLMEDSYNASPESMEAALEALSILAGPTGRKLAALGCMLELGPFAPEAHRRVGEQVAELGYDLLLVYGPDADDVLMGARTIHPELPSCSCADHREMAARLVASLQPGDYLLVKGSRGYAMEQVTALLLQMIEEKPGDDQHVDS